MQSFYRVEYRRDKDATAGTLIERIAGAVEASGSAQHPVSFSFSEPFIPGARSTIDYLVKSFPIFESYRSVSKGRATLGGTYVTDIPADGSKRPPVPVSTLIEVAHGIPRRFNFGNASFIWRNVPALDLQPDAPRPDSGAAGFHGRLIGRFGDPGIYVASAWGAPNAALT